MRFIALTIFNVSIIIIWFVGFIGFSSCRPLDTKKELANKTVRLITHNVWYGFSKIPDRKTVWTDWIRDQDPDILLLQELNGYTNKMLVQEAKAWNHPYAVLLKEDGFPTGITARYPMEDIKIYTEGFHHGLIRVKIAGVYIYVIHLHPSNWEFRHREMDLIFNNLEMLPKSAPILLAGDFNTFSSTDSIFYDLDRLSSFFHTRDIQFGEKNLNQGKLDFSVLDRLITADYIDLVNRYRGKESHFKGSFPTWIEKEGDHGDERRLDYIFTSSNMLGHVTEAKIIADSLTMMLSDHLPVLAEIRWPEPWEFQ